MHKLALAGLLAASGLLTGCVNQPQSLYYWNGYQEQVYARFKGEGSSPQEQVAALEASLQEARAQDQLEDKFRDRIAALASSAPTTTAPSPSTRS